MTPRAEEDEARRLLACLNTHGAVLVGDIIGVHRRDLVDPTPNYEPVTHTLASFEQLAQGINTTH